MGPTKLGVRVKRLREACGWTQATLAKRARVTQGLISQLEVGLTKDLSATVAVRVARALGVTVEDLVR